MSDQKFEFCGYPSGECLLWDEARTSGAADTRIEILAKLRGFEGWHLWNAQEYPANRELHQEYAAGYSRAYRVISENTPIPNRIPATRPEQEENPNAPEN